MVGVVLYSTGPVFVQASQVSGPVFSFWRLWFGVAVLGGATLVQVRARGGWPDARAWRLVVAAGAAFGAHQLLLFSAVKATSVASVTLVSAISPIVTAVLAFPMFRERPGVTFRAWSLVAMVGAGLVVFAGSTGPRGDPLGMLLALGNVVAFAAFFLACKRSRDHLAVVPFLFGVFTVAALFVSAYMAFAGACGCSTGSDAVTAVGPTDLLLAAVVAAGPGFAGHFLSTWPLRRLPANVPPVLQLGIPVLASTWAWWLLGEPISRLHIVAGAVILAGVAGAVLCPSGRRFVAGEAVARSLRRPHSLLGLRPARAHTGD